MKRSPNRAVPGGATALPCRSCSSRSVAVTSSGAMDRASRKCLGSPGTRMLTWPYASNPPSSARMGFAATRSSIALARACSRAAAAGSGGGCPPGGVGCVDTGGVGRVDAGGWGVVGCCALATAATASATAAAEIEAERCKVVMSAPSERDLLARLDREHLHLRVAQRLLVLGRRARELRNGPVVDGQRELRLEQLPRGVGRVLRIHHEMPADGDEQQVGVIPLADHLHVAEQPRVAHVVEAGAGLQLEG